MEHKYMQFSRKSHPDMFKFVSDDVVFIDAQFFLEADSEDIYKYGRVVDTIETTSLMYYHCDFFDSDLVLIDFHDNLLNNKKFEEYLELVICN